MSVLVGRQAPDFCSSAVLGNGQVESAFQLSQRCKDKYVLLCFYPLDFTFVCPTELIALDKRMPQFKERNVEVLTVSIDSQFSHVAWRNAPLNQGGIGPVSYTMIADVSHRICQAYGVEHPQANVAFRASFLIDKSGIVRAQYVNDLPLGRNVDELIRLVDALQYFEANGEVCPAGWQKGKKAMQPNAAGVAAYLEDNAENL